MKITNNLKSTYQTQNNMVKKHLRIVVYIQINISIERFIVNIFPIHKPTIQPIIRQVNNAINKRTHREIFSKSC